MIRKDLSINFVGVKCENPFFLASCPVGGHYEMVAKAFDSGWGGVFYKTIGMTPMNEVSPRFDEVTKEAMPWLGFKNMEQISDKTPELNLQAIRKLKANYPGKVVVASIMGSNAEEWRQLAIMCEDAGADLLEGNFSCPQMTSHAMGSDVGTNPELVGAYTHVVTAATDLPFIAKMTPNITSMQLPAIAAIENGAAGISAVNTVKSITHIDLEALAPLPVISGKSSISGYSGAAIKPIGLRWVAELLRDPALRTTQVSGIGGIETWRDAVEYLLLGCRNLQVGTGIMQYGYRIVEDLISGLSHFMDERGYSHLEDFVGTALPNVVPAEDLDRDHVVLPHFDWDACIGCGRCYVSCFDGGHQAIDWDAGRRRPRLNDNCVGCHLCIQVCPVAGCITPGEVRLKTAPATA